MPNQNEQPAFRINKSLVEFILFFMGSIILVAAVLVIVFIGFGKGEWQEAIVTGLSVGFFGAALFVGYFATGRSIEHDHAISWEKKAQELEARVAEEPKQQSDQDADS